MKKLMLALTMAASVSLVNIALAESSSLPLFALSQVNTSTKQLLTFSSTDSFQSFTTPSASNLEVGLNFKFQHSNTSGCSGPLSPVGAPSGYTIGNNSVSCNNTAHASKTYAITGDTLFAIATAPLVGGLTVNQAAGITCVITQDGNDAGLPPTVNVQPVVCTTSSCTTAATAQVISIAFSNLTACS